MNEPIGNFLLGFASIVLLYTYFLYPIVITLLARLIGRLPAKSDALPPVSFIITAHNEERNIERKLENTLQLDYPSEKLEIIVTSDASTDGTEAIVERFSDRGVRLVSSPARSGKTAATQHAVRSATGEVLVFSDATGLYNQAALRHLVAALSDPTVGCVSGRVEFRYGDSALARGFRAYQKLIKALRRQEARCGVLTSVSGSIHSTRRAGFPVIDPHQNYDLVLPLEMANRGLRCVYANEAISLEVARARPKDEFSARVRAALRSYAYLTEVRRRSGLFHNPLYLWALVSGKILRWVTPMILLCLFIGHGLASVRGEGWLWSFVAHAGLYALAGVAAALPSSRLARRLSTPIFVVTACAGYLVGFVRFLQGERAATWQSPR